MMASSPLCAAQRGVPCCGKTMRTTLAPSRQATLPACRAIVASRPNSRLVRVSAAGFGAGAKSSAKKGNKNEKGVGKGQTPADPDACPCGSSRKLADCCGSYLGNVLAVEPNAEAVLRARFTAYNKRDVDYVVRTTHHDNPDLHRSEVPEECVPQLRKDVEATCASMEFVRLTVVRVEETEGGHEAFVTFRASVKTSKRFREGKKVDTQTLSERSRFLREDGRWLYRSTLPLSANTLQDVK